MTDEVKPERHKKQTEPLGLLRWKGEAPDPPLEKRYTNDLEQDDQFDKRYTNDPEQKQNSTSRTIPKSDSPPPIYEFSVLVALEWEPSDQERQELADAFLQASEFLYNVTDNYMAFGRVIIGGKELMECADIQIMASNRFSPRSWVNALNEEAKYTPIRAGRGIWNRNDRRTELWKDLASVRTLIHEWAHYALGLPDQYLEALPVVLERSTQQNATLHRQTATSAYLLVDKSGRAAIGDTFVIIPKIPVSNGGIMEVVTGKEFVASDEPDKEKRYKEIWDKIKERYQKVQPSGRTDYEARDLPTVPNISFVKREQGELLSLEQWNDSQPSSNENRELWLKVPTDKISAEHSWIYVVKGDLGDRPRIEQIVAQGTFDAPSRTIGFKLLNAQQGDWLVIVGKDKKGGDIVLRSPISRIDQRTLNGRDQAIVNWEEDVTPDPFPVIDVIPLPCERNKAITDIQVCIRSVTQPVAWISPLGGKTTTLTLDQASSDPSSGLWVFEACSPTSLDGHVLMLWDRKTAICTYSQGGGPATHVAARYSPITAGSSEGNAMIFFADKAESQQYAHVRVVTTLIHSSFGTQQSEIEPRSYVFSVASNATLPLEYNPTLVLYFDKHAPKEGGALIIHRLENGTWQPMPTYVASDHGRSFAAMPLNPTTAESLFAADDRPRAEQYRLFWMPHETPAPDQASQSDVGNELPVELGSNAGAMYEQA